MKAVHFGAGNIGRGFIGMLLYRAGYHTTFVDVNNQVIEAINKEQSYQVILADDQQRSEQISQISGINSLENPQAVIDAITEADIVTTAVGANILPLIAELIAQGLTKRLTINSQPLNIIACENMIGGSDLLKEKVFEFIKAEDQEKAKQQYGFPNAAVDRIVPNQTHDQLLTVSVEPYYEWVVDEQGLKGDRPVIEGITYVSDLTPFIERKLFTVNTGHAVAAYLGYYLGFDTIKDVMDSEHVLPLVKGALSETGSVLIKQYQFDAEAHQSYIDKIISRFQNPHISDQVTRVARGPLRKLGKQDRLVRPALLYFEKIGQEPVFLAKAIAAALSYDYEQDQEAKELQWSITENGMAKAFQLVAELEPNHPLINSAINQLIKLERLKAMTD
ncbi:mannitol-1-phosphate 5-dehydrogenase [Amphibacillus sediminis]|uniref:mannitol-1-phosphate 5-dehydrogenase n=1 Tax=Amphibacillus sediminis TaxID=360185 RepID=UPI0008338878|nr:mannitol-1-phosphate 5-dehydrogenase [Amphibacillus sediminis]